MRLFVVISCVLVLSYAASLRKTEPEPAPLRLSFSCLACTGIIDVLRFMIEDQKSEDDLDKILENACVFLDIEQRHVCDFIVKAFSNEVYFVLDRSYFTPNEICGAIVDDCGNAVNPLAINWTIPIPAGKPPVKPWPTVPANKPTLRVLHLSDIHIDRQYAEGSEANCQDDNIWDTYALCCRNYPDDDPRAAADATIPAGRWGSPYNCDIPYRTFEHAMKHISQTEKNLDWIIITGDMEAHDSWDYSRDLTKNNIENVTNVLLNYFPNTKIYISVGNHEGVPQDAFAPHTMEEYDTRGPQWLYSIFSDSWGHWIGEEAKKGVQYRASYVEYPAPGLKLISFNSIYCSEFNFYLYINQTDPDDTLQWLISELLDSEAKGEKVHLISHIPAGDSYCLKGWAYNFYEIVNRFENTIAGQYYGHTHNDHFQVYYDNSDVHSRPTHVNFISPSITTYSYSNPSYRIYTIDGGYDGATYTTIDAETYYTNITEANARGEPEWKLEYSTREAYGMADLSPASFNDLINRMADDVELFKKFHLYFRRNENYEPNCASDAKCRASYICYFKTAKSHDDSFCA